jgi:hypothetical protein
MHLPDYKQVSLLETRYIARHYPSHLELYILFCRQKKKKGHSTWIPHYIDAAY